MATLEDVMHEVFNGVGVEVLEHLSNCPHQQSVSGRRPCVVLLSYIAWKLYEIERKTMGPPGP